MRILEYSLWFYAVDVHLLSHSMIPVDDLALEAIHQHLIPPSTAIDEMTYPYVVRVIIYAHTQLTAAASSST